MGMESIVYGRIAINYESNLSDVQTYIKSLGNEALIKANMFGLGSSSYYDNPIVTFGASYKSIEYHWNDFMQEFEHILKNIYFETARIKLETEVEGTYDFFWAKNTVENTYEESEKMVETKEWYFGFGDRDRWGFLNTETDEPIFTHEGFKYPIVSLKN